MKEREAFGFTFVSLEYEMLEDYLKDIGLRSLSWVGLDKNGEKRPVILWRSDDMSLPSVVLMPEDIVVNLDGKTVGIFKGDNREDQVISEIRAIMAYRNKS